MFIRQNYRIYPNKEQKKIIDEWIGCARFIWNYMLEKNIKKYQEEKKFIFCYEMNNILPSMKKSEDFKWLRNAPSQGLQQKCQDLDTAIKASFKKTDSKKGFPKFKSKKRDESGIRFQDFKFKNNKLYLPKIKQGIKINMHREFLGKAGMITVIKDRCEDYFVSFTVDIGTRYDEIISLNDIKTVAGIDMGIKSFATLDSGEKIQNPKFLKSQSKKLKRLQRKHSKKKSDSNNKEKSRIKLARLNRRIANQRKDFIKQNAALIAKKYDLICVENLDVKGMQSKHYIAKYLVDVSFSNFIAELEWQCKKRGKILCKVDRYFPSSKTCSNCGNINNELHLNERIYHCPKCGFEIDRDLNAAINIVEEGKKKLDIKIPTGRGKLTPVRYEYSKEIQNRKPDCF